MIEAIDPSPSICFGLGLSKVFVIAIASKLILFFGRDRNIIHAVDSVSARSNIEGKKKRGYREQDAVKARIKAMKNYSCLSLSVFTR